MWHRIAKYFKRGENAWIIIYGDPEARVTQRICYTYDFSFSWEWFKYSAITTAITLRRGKL